MSQKVKLKIQRFDPKKDKNPYFKEYIVNVEGWETILDLVRKVHNEMDGTLAFKMSCNSGVCGACAMRINKRACLACKIMLKDELKKYGEIVVEPLGNLEIEKDLIVDMEPFYKTIKKIEPWIKNKGKVPKEEFRVGEEEIEEAFNAAKCLWCAACFSDCPSRKAEKEYFGPASFVNASRYINDPRDNDSKERIKKVVKGNIWMCAHCEKSTENCPEDIKPTELISILREKSINKGIKHNKGAKHALSINKSILQKGELDEVALLFDTLGMFGLTTYMPIILRMLAKGKKPPIILKKIKNIHELKRLSEIINEKKQKEAKENRKKRIKYKNLEDS